MQDSATISLDNQFIRVAEPRPARPMPAVRYDYSSTLANLRQPQLPSRPTGYLDAIKERQPIARRLVQPEPIVQKTIAIKSQKNHRPLISHEFFQSVLEASNPALVEPSGKRSRLRLPKFNKLQLATISLAAVLLAGGIYLSLAGWQATNISKKQAKTLTAMVNKLVQTKPAVSPSTKTPALATTPIPAQTLAEYTVAPTLPRYLIIPSLNVDARILSVGVTSTGALATPDNVFDTAWYNQSSLPGQPGAMLIDGHVSSWTSHGVFYGLKDLVAGDTIKIERGDGTMFTYQVVKTQVFTSTNVDMQSTMVPVVAGQPGLNLITCTGDVIPGTSTFNERIIVYATQTS